ncbi:hypothetical protein [Marinoscillum furvescens]|nr:hypothetical protein [Marinoscillum furvescens]
MKTLYKYLTLMLLVVGFMACTPEYEAPAPEPNHFSVFLSEQDFDNTVQVGTDLDFIDVSRGVQERVWTFPEGVADIVGQENDVTSEAHKIKVIFKEPGTHEVSLHLEFAGEAWVEEELRGNALDTVYTVTVLDSIQASFKANLIDYQGNDQGEITLADGGASTNKIEAGSSLRFVVTSTGNPAENEWVFEGGTPAEFSPEPGNNGDTLTVAYKKLGTYSIQLISQRGRPAGADTVTYENFIEIVPSSAPILIDKAFQAEDQVAISFSRELDDPRAEAENFSVTIKNNGQVITPTVSEVRLDPDDASTLLLVLGGEKLYNSDTVSVNYTPGNLQSTDFAQVASFSDLMVEMDKENILAAETSTMDYGFENSTDANWPYLWWGGQWAEYTSSISTAKAHSGVASNYIAFNANGGMIIGHKDEAGNNYTFTPEPGKTYEIGMWIYVEDLGPDPDAMEQPNIMVFWTPETDWGVGRYSFTSSTPVGEWIYVSTMVTAQFNSEGPYGVMIRGFNGNNPGPLSFYMDDLNISEVQMRP